MRPLFTDGWNSFWHVMFGILATQYSIIIPIYVIYQLFDWYDVNMMIDLLEFFIGFIIFYFIIEKPINEVDIVIPTVSQIDKPISESDSVLPFDMVP